MPVDWRRYPASWPAIRARILEREGRRCKWCGAPDRGWRIRFPGAADEFTTDPMAAEVEFCGGARVVRIVLTVAHLGVPRADGSPGDKHDKLDCRDENLAALCQACHLNYDRDDHRANAAATRRARRIAAGQLPLGVAS